jgi:hypothetical protein
MNNAYLRFGSLVYHHVGRKTSTQVRATLDRFIGEPLTDGRSARAHLVSLFGTDTAIAGLHAAIAAGEAFTVEAPEGSRMSACLGQRASCYRGSLPLPAGRWPLRHLIAISEELAGGICGEKERTILLADGDEFVWSSLAGRHGLPGSPEWAPWIVAELRRQRRLVALSGIGCDPILVKAGRSALLTTISRGLRRGALRFPEKNGAVTWPSFDLETVLQQRF